MLDAVVVLAVASALAACTPKNLLHATKDYASVSNATLLELRQAPRIVSELCLQNAEIEYLALRVVLPAKAPETFAAFYTSPVKIDLVGAPTITWKQYCNGYREVEMRFDRALGVLEKYGAALGAFASEDESYQDSIKGIASSVADGAAAVAPQAEPYKETLSGLGTPIGFIANTLKTRWKAKEIRTLVGDVDPQLADIIGKLDAFVQLARTRERRAVSEAWDRARARLESIRMGAAPPAEGAPLAVHKIDLITATVLDIQYSTYLAATDRKLAALSETLKKLAAAHAELRRAWSAGEDQAGAGAVKRITELTDSIRDDMGAFRHPARDPL